MHKYLKNIKVRSLYKGIIRLRAIINYFDKSPSSIKFNELKEFLLSIFSY